MMTENKFTTNTKNHFKQFFAYRELFLIYIISLSVQLIGIILLKYFITGEIIIYDPRFLQAAKNLFEFGSMKIAWGVTNNPADIMIDPYNIQKGIYYNWFPPGYSIFIYTLILLFNDYQLPLIIVQMFIYSLIPVLFFLLLKNYFGNKFSLKILFAAVIIFILNPFYVVASQWKSDTWMITLITLYAFYMMLKCIKSNYPVKTIILFSLLLAILFFFKPVAVFGFILLWGIIATRKIFNKIFHKAMLIPIISMAIIIFGWTLKNKILFNEYSLTYSNVGYNLWLGNNEHTYDFLKSHFGDGATIEDRIIPIYDSTWSFLSNYNEYEKNYFFTQQAISFIKENPIITIKNMFWKFVGFFSPLRMREGHWSDSKLKTFLTLAYNIPILILSLLSVIRYFLKKEYRVNKEKGIFILFIILWMLPHLIFFSSARFRAPIDFAIFILAVDYFISFYKNQSLLS